MKYFTFILLAFLFTLTSCGNDPDCTEAGVNQEIDSFISEINQLVADFNAENSEDNCNKLLDKSKDLVEYLESLRSCTEIDQTDLENTISEARSDLNSISC